MTTPVKICGITNKEDAQMAVGLGAWALGFIFYDRSPRYVSASKVRKILDSISGKVTPVAVFVNETVESIQKICEFTGIENVQLHGDEPAAYCRKLTDLKVIKAFRVQEGFDFGQVAQYQTDVYLFDTYTKKNFGGSGKSFDWNMLKGRTFDVPIILSGGLNPDNITEAIAKISPYAVDVSSGVEKSPGIKDHKLMKQLFNRIP